MNQSGIRVEDCTVCFGIDPESEADVAECPNCWITTSLSALQQNDHQDDGGVLLLAFNENGELDTLEHVIAEQKRADALRELLGP